MIIDSSIEIVVEQARALAVVGTRVIGELHWMETGEIAYVRTVAKFRRQGIATSLWRAVEATGVHLKHSDAINSDGRAWAASFRPTYA